MEGGKIHKKKWEWKKGEYKRKQNEKSSVFVCVKEQEGAKWGRRSESKRSRGEVEEEEEEEEDDDDDGEGEGDDGERKENKRRSDKKHEKK